jgi:hypothetical protein
MNAHYQNRALCRAPRAHDKGKNTHDTAFAVRALAHGKRRPAHFYPVKNFVVRFGKGNAVRNT